MSDLRSSLNGKIALVTGGGSGIGLGFVRMAIEAGARVVVADLRLSEALAATIGASNEQAKFVHTDVRKRGDLETAIGFSLQIFGDVPDIYVANAGVFEPSAKANESPKQWSNFWLDTEGDSYATAEINFTHPLKLTRLATRALLGAKKPGVVVLVSSTVGLSWSYPAALYCATKHALIGFTRSMAPAESLNGVKVVCLCPGIVDTPLWQTREGLSEQFSVSDKVSITPEDVAAAMVDLIVNEKYKGGTVLKVDRSGVKVIEFSGKTRDLKDEDLVKVKDRSFAPVQDLLAAEIGRPWGGVSDRL
ncbi:hypothetical protein AUEXF2481DRAFT_32714 [Aureobasidium subglaciale EXF-2481]|uniref:NAD(P)-binding protein n=1 Tax=Aureobasidium subglaciale (strain EXF-2481) TaxID=1043005 RepID=A0A074YY01_AURSE|nr:uncharacterized protein AUEXF2481DRAFT_32714 [Aureobasidium subglaciale EXF-2481]KEQ91741.1 hypothetical protein AUEXF2481DRAFT_32714 [Aureobasidium subglaciale EXF-2481]